VEGHADTITIWSNKGASASDARFALVWLDRKALLPAQVLLGDSDFKVVNRSIPSPLSLIPGTLLLAVILLVQKLIALLAS